MYLTNKAFDLAEKYQITSIILTDQYLADSQWSYERIDLTNLKYKDYRLRKDNFQNLNEYKRHAFTETGVSPLGIPGDSTHLVVTDSDEHDEEGHITEDSDTRIKMVEKRLFRKMTLIKREIEPPKVYGEQSPDIVLLCWGSMYGIVKEVVDELSNNFKIAMLHFSELYPFSDQQNWIKVLNNAELSINIEQNATSQFSRLLKMETGIYLKNHINRFDGRPFTADELKEKVYAYLRKL